MLAKLLLLFQITTDPCPLAMVRTPIGYCAVPLFTFGQNGIQLWQLNDYNSDGSINIADIQLIINAVMTGQATSRGPADITDVQATVNAALNPVPVTPPGTTGLPIP